MDNKDFDEFVKRQQGGASIASVETNWEKERDDWLAHLDHLYMKIESFLTKYVASGQIRYEYRLIELNEENIGSYSAKEMLLRIGRQEVDFVPIGTLLVGSKGRVDINGPAGKAQLLLVDKNALGAAQVVFRVKVGAGGRLLAPSESPQQQEIQWEWKILSRPPERRLAEITQESLFQLIMEVANG